MINGNKKAPRTRGAAQPTTIIQLIFAPEQSLIPDFKTCLIVAAVVLVGFVGVWAMAWLYMYVFGGFA